MGRNFDPFNVIHKLVMFPTNRLEDLDFITVDYHIVVCGGVEYPNPFVSTKQGK